MTDGVDHEVRALLSQALDRLETRHGFTGRRDGAIPRAPDAGAWREMAEFGLVGLGYPVASGGFGAGSAAIGSVARAIGRSLLLVPYLSTAVLVPALLDGLPPEHPGLALDDILAGRRIIAVAHAEARLGYAPGPLATAASQDGEAATISGRKTFVLDAPLADAFLVSAATPQGRTELFLVERGAPGLRVEGAHGVDERPIGDLALAATPALRLGSPDASQALAEALDRGALAACAEALGSMEKVLEAVMSHLQTRRAFGQPLAGFQVLRHRFADMHVAVEEVRAVLGAAEQAWDTVAEDRAALLRACKVTTCRNSRFVAEQGIQLHGGIGVTDDLDISHHFKRMMMLEACFGDGGHHLGRHAVSLFADHAAGHDAGRGAT